MSVSFRENRTILRIIRHSKTVNNAVFNSTVLFDLEFLLPTLITLRK